MMLQANKLFEQYNFKPKKYSIKGKTILLETTDGNFAIKEKNRNKNTNILNYLDSRSFNYYPNIIHDDDTVLITEAIKEIDMPREQKMMDMIDLVSLLHNKTTYYKEVDVADYKKLYEDITNNIAYLESYYSDYLDIFLTHVFNSPSEYLLSRNSSKIFSSLTFARNELDAWYQIIKDKRKQRVVVLHNNLDINHFIRNKKSYLVSWDKSKIGIPIFDIYKLYKKQGLEYEFSELLKRYENSYPLLKEERQLLFILMALPDKIDFDDKEYDMCIKISRLIDSLYKSEMIISPYYSKPTKDEYKEEQK